jgi:thiamine-phosphate pyrophosphorylase
LHTDTSNTAAIATPAGARWGLAQRRLYLCTPDRPDLEAFLVDCISGGVDVVQLRDKHLDDATTVARARLAQRVCADHGVPFVLNDRPDLALESGADGVHVGQDDIDPLAARALLGPDALLGLSTHQSDELAVAIGHGMGVASPAPVDYVSAGPVVPTPTKPGRPGTGLGYVTYAVTQSPWPVWVTGGASPDSVGSLVEAGARHVVVVRWITESSDPGAAARLLRQAIDAAIEEAERREDTRG